MAKANRPVFRTKLSENLSEDALALVQETEEPHVDRYGRVSYFFAKLLNLKIWLFQPGTLMFEGGVNQGDLAVK